MDLDDAAWRIWDVVYPDLIKSKPGLFGALVARAEAHVMRMAGLYALLDGSVAIQVCHPHAALALWDYAERSALHIFGRSLGDPLADAVLSGIQSADKDGLTRTELHEHFSGHTTARELSRALVTLAGLGQVQMVKETGQGRGRPAERYFFAGQDDELVAGGYLDLAISSLSSRGSAESGSEAGAQFTLYEKEAKKNMNTRIKGALSSHSSRAVGQGLP